MVEKTKAKPSRKRRTKAEMEAARVAETKSSKPKQKRKRRTKAEMEAARVASLPPEPKCYEIGYKGPKPPPAKPKKKSRSYPPPPPIQKFDTSLIDEQIKFPGPHGAQYAITKETKHGRHLLSFGIDDWSILYNARYNNTEKHWKFYLDLYKESCDNDKIVKSKKVKNNGRRNATTKSNSNSGRSNTKGNSTRKDTTSSVRKGRRNSKSNALHDKSEDRAVA
jgi:hypothetical protein